MYFVMLKLSLYFCIIDTQGHTNSIVICVHNNIKKNNGLILLLLKINGNEKGSESP